jgi:hypothetical protein
VEKQGYEVSKSQSTPAGSKQKAPVVLGHQVVAPTSQRPQQPLPRRLQDCWRLDDWTCAQRQQDMLLCLRWQSSPLWQQPHPPSFRLLWRPQRATIGSERARRRRRWPATRRRRRRPSARAGLPPPAQRTARISLRCMARHRVPLLQSVFPGRAFRERARHARLATGMCKRRVAWDGQAPKAGWPGCKRRMARRIRHRCAHFSRSGATERIPLNVCIECISTGHAMATSIAA